jgi:methionyl-tRNA formyltransferase
MGSGKFGLDCIEALHCSNHNISAAVTACAKPAGRGRKPKKTPVAEWAQNKSIEIIETDNVNSPESIEKISAYNPDLIVVIAFGQKISRKVIETSKHDAINVHGSLLPKYRGAAPVNWAIINGERQTGISIITLADKMDAGDILAQKSVEIKPTETAGQLHDKLATLSGDILIETVNKIQAGTAEYQKQDDSKATLAPKLKKSDGYLDFTKPADKLECLIRGLCPWPGAQAEYFSRKTGKKIKVKIDLAEFIVNANPKNLPAGTVDDNLNVICEENSLKISKIKPEGSRTMNFDDFVNGRACKPGDMFLKIAK